MTERVFLSGANLVLADRIESGRTLVIESGRVTDFAAGPRDIGPSETRVHLPGCFVLPGFVDVHVHGIGGHDVMDSGTAVDRVAALLPRHGVTAFCPTSIACDPSRLESFLANVSATRQAQAEGCARVLGAHLESNFINAAFAGAQPVECIRSPLSLAVGAGDSASFTGADILDVLERHRADVQILTLAPELDGALALVGRLVAMGIRVSLGHSGATFDQGQAAIAAGARQATHLFNRMPPLTHREPGLAGAILASNDVAAELICDGHHVHPAVLRMAIAAKGLPRIMAVTDATAGAGLPRGSRAVLGGRAITVRDVAELDDGTIAGSVATMDRVFGCLVGQCGLDIREAAEICATTPARELGLVGFGVISPGSWAVSCGSRPAARTRANLDWRKTRVVWNIRPAGSVFIVVTVQQVAGGLRPRRTPLTRSLAGTPAAPLPPPRGYGGARRSASREGGRSRGSLASLVRVAFFTTTMLGAPACVLSVDHEGTIEREEKRFQVEKIAELHLYTFDGAIEVRSWDKPEIVVQIEKRGQDKEAVSKIEVLSEQNGDRLQVEARHTAKKSFVEFGVFHTPRARLVANVPRKTNLVVRTGDGAIVVERVDGRAEVRTGDGSIRMTETTGEVLAETSDGSIQLEDVSGRVEARTNDGSLRVSGTPSVVRARTGDGDIVLRVRNGAAMTEDWMIATTDGSITIELPDGFNAEIEADPSSDGRVRNDLTLSGQTGGTREARALRGVLGEGGKRLTVRTGDGNIRLTNY